MKKWMKCSNEEAHVSGEKGEYVALGSRLKGVSEVLTLV